MIRIFNKLFLVNFIVRFKLFEKLVRFSNCLKNWCFQGIPDSFALQGLVTAYMLSQGPEVQRYQECLGNTSFSNNLNALFMNKPNTRVVSIADL